MYTVGSAQFNTCNNLNKKVYITLLFKHTLKLHVFVSFVYLIIDPTLHDNVTILVSGDISQNKSPRDNLAALFYVFLI